jgi:hypothetical protein
MSEVCSRTGIDAETVNGLFKGANRDLAPRVLQIFAELEDYWPLSLRQAYYRCVAGLLISNNSKQYRRLMGICKTLREQDLLSWHAMEDRARRTTEKRGLSGLEEFLSKDLESTLNWRYYHRCHLQGQEVYCEVTVEKDALAPLVEEVVYRLCTRMSVTKGQPSVTLMEQIARRMDAAMQRGQEPILLHFGDLDPTGVQIPLSMKATLWDVHSLDVDVRVGGLTPEQCVEYDLPQSLDAAKRDDPNYRRWIDRFGTQAPTELDAMHPATLQALVQSRLLGIYDDELMEEQRAREKEDELVLKSMRRSMLDHLRSAFPAYKIVIDEAARQ